MSVVLFLLACLLLAHGCPYRQRGRGFAQLPRPPRLVSPQTAFSGGATLFGLAAALGTCGISYRALRVTSIWSSLRLGLATTACPRTMALVLLWMQRQPVADFREGNPVTQAA